MGRRIGTSIFGIPVWIITGLALFILFSAGYDWIVQDRSNLRVLFAVISGGVILLMSLILHLIPLKTVAKQASRQMGN